MNTIIVPANKSIDITQLQIEVRVLDQSAIATFGEEDGGKVYVFSDVLTPTQVIDIVAAHNANGIKSYKRVVSKKSEVLKQIESSRPFYEVYTGVVDNEPLGLLMQYILADEDVEFTRSAKNG